MTLDGIHLLFRYDRWATEKLLRALEPLSPEAYTAPGCSAHGSIRDTLAHLFSVQHGWISWLEGSMPVERAIQALIRGEEIPTVAAARERWAPVARQAEAFVGSLTEGRLNEAIPWSLPDGASGRTLLWKLLLHVANHGTHTRGQIVAAVRRAGHAPGTAELMHMLLSEPDPAPSDAPR